MALLRTEPERFRQRSVPIELARAFDGAAVFIAIFRGRRSSERGGVEKSEWSSATNAHVWISDLICAQGKTRSCPVIGCRAAEISRIGISGLPSNDVLQPPISKNVFRPAMIAIAMVFAKWQLVHREHADLMADVE